MIIKSNSVIGLSAGLLALGMGSFGGYEFELAYAVFLFFSTLFIYNLLRIIKFQFNPDSAQAKHFKEDQPMHIVLSVFSLLGALFVYMATELFRDIYLNVLLIVGSIISVFYALPFIVKSNKNLALRDMPYMKVFLIGIVWSLLCFYYPTRNHPYTRELTLSGFLYIFSITIPFDIRDLPFDTPNQKTIPQLFGWRAAKLITVLINCVYFAYIAYLFPSFYSSVLFWMLCGVHIYILQRVNPNRSTGFYAYYVDGLIGVTGLFFWYTS